MLSTSDIFQFFRSHMQSIKFNLPRVVDSSFRAVARSLLFLGNVWLAMVVFWPLRLLSSILNGISRLFHFGVYFLDFLQEFIMAVGAAAWHTGYDTIALFFFPNRLNRASLRRHRKDKPAPWAEGNESWAFVGSNSSLSSSCSPSLIKNASSLLESDPGSPPDYPDSNARSLNNSPSVSPTRASLSSSSFSSSSSSPSASPRSSSAIEHLPEQCRSLLLENNELRKCCQALRQELSALTAGHSLSPRSPSYSEEKQRLLSETPADESLVKRCDQLETDKAELEKEKLELEKQRDELTQQRDELAKKRAELLSSLKKLASQYHVVTQEKESMQTELKSVKDKNSDLAKRVDSQRHKLEERKRGQEVAHSLLTSKDMRIEELERELAKHRAPPPPQYRHTASSP